MTPHLQTYFACPVRNDGYNAEGIAGDCWRTAIACLLDIDPHTVPHFVNDFGKDWMNETANWLWRHDLAHGYSPLPVPESEPYYEWFTAALNDTEYALLDGPSPRGDFYHVVVGSKDAQGNWYMVHDPHPSQAGLVGIEGVHLILPRETWQEHGVKF